MKKIYDILVNFNKNAYEFYEWNKDDLIEHIKSIECFKVSNNCLNDFINNDVKVNKNFLDNLYNKTELYGGKLIKNIEDACIVYNDVQAFSFEFNKEGFIKFRSFLLFDEEDDVINNSKKEVLANIDYKVLKYNKKNIFLTRKEIKTINIINSYLDNIKNSDEIKYLYFECYDKKEESISKAYDMLKNSINCYDKIVIKRLYDIIGLLKK